MSEHDDPVARAYRELRREVPSAALDKKVLGAARSAVAPRSFTRRWAAPLSAAAILVLAVGVTMQMQREEAKNAAAPQEAVPARAKESAAVPEVAAPAPAARPDAQEIPFAPRRPVDPVGAGGDQKVEAATAAASAAAAARTVAPASPAPGPVTKGGVSSPSDLARAQREAADAVRGFGILSPPATSTSNAAGGPFSIDQATTTGVQVRIVEPH